MRTDWKIYYDTIDTAEKAGIYIISNDKCCQLLAWLLVIGGYTEESTHNKKLTIDLQFAAKRLNIGGAQTPNQKLLPVFRTYNNELIEYIKKKKNKPQWLIKIEEYYKLKPYKNN